jgi:hypothetical protein
MPRGNGARPPRSTFRRGSHLDSWVRRQRMKRRRLVAQRGTLDSDLQEWVELTFQRKMLASAAEANDQSWEEQALAQKLPVDKAGHARHMQCTEFIATHGLRRGVCPWSRTARIEAVENWEEYERLAGLPKGETLRMVYSDALSFPLTAALAARTAGIAAAPNGQLSLVVLGPEGAELAGRKKWAELLNGHGLNVHNLFVSFVGPEVPKRLDGTSLHARTEAGGEMHFLFLRGLWHDPKVQLRLTEAHATPQLALAFNSGFAEHAKDWLPTFRDLFWRREVPLACTSYHPPEAELDCRSLHLKLGVPAKQVVFSGPNPFTSKLPHLDELFPGQVYSANAFLAVCATKAP